MIARKLEVIDDGSCNLDSKFGVDGDDTGKLWLHLTNSHCILISAKFGQLSTFNHDIKHSLTMR
jgi:hypothetical protein